MACPQRGKKRESSGESGQKRGSRMVPARDFAIASWRNPLKKMQRVPAGPINVISLAGAEFAAVIPKRNAKNCIVFEAKITTS